MSVRSGSAIKDFRRPREGGDPVSFDKKSLGSRLRGNDGVKNCKTSNTSIGTSFQPFMLGTPHQCLIYITLC